MTIRQIARHLRRGAGYPFRKLRRWRRRRNIITIDKESPRKPGVLFIGYAEGALGLGQAFRSDLDAVATTDIRFAVYPFRVNIETRLLPTYMPERYDQTHIYDINVIEVAADQLPLLYDELNNELLKNSYNILRTYWELPSAPAAWRQFLVPINEIWAPNAFVAESFRVIFDRPIRIVQPVVNAKGAASPNRAEFGMKDGRFYFLFSFDYHSSAYRKNPSAVLKAFRLAFPMGNENVGLVLKSNGDPRACQEFVAELNAAVAGDKRIIVLDGHMPRDVILGLISSTDAYVSLHRSEGFGLGMAEALSMGRIVIATGYSGNADFLTEETGFPIPFEMRSVLSHEYPYAEGQQWAEPNIQAAATAMRQVATDPYSARKQVEAGQQLIQNYYNVDIVGQRMQLYFADIAHVAGI